MPILKPTVIVIAGPTAIGKSSVAAHLAQSLSCEILNADSRQIYRELNIGTAKPMPEELKATPHHFINSHSITERFTAADYADQALSTLDHIWQRHSVAILSGGTGLYIKGVLEGFDKIPTVDNVITDELEIELQRTGIHVLQDELRLKDPQYYEVVDKSNHRRIMRALSVIRMTGEPFSSYLNNEPPDRKFNPLKILLQMDRQKLYERINLRVDKMMDMGLLDEVKALIQFHNLPSLQTVGYQELFDHVRGDTSLSEAVDLIKRNSRRYAKRQMTWFRNRPGWKIFSPHELREMLNHIKQSIPE